MKRFNVVNEKRGRLGPVVLAGILIALAGTAIPAQAAFTSITTCNPAVAAPAGSLINTPGDYSVNQDLASVGDCILITSSGVSLKLNGHIITGPVGANVGINVNPPSGRVDHVGIQGPGLIRNFLNGITMNNTDYSQVSQVTASANASNGINGAGSTFLTVSSNVLVQNGIWGLLLTNLTNSTVSSNEVTGNGGGLSVPAAGGIRVTGTADTINNNAALGNGSHVGTPSFNAGIVIGTTFSRVTGNVTDGNVLVGILVSSGATSNQIFSNTSSIGNAVNDLEDDNATCDSNLWANNNFLIRSQTCIH